MPTTIIYKGATLASFTGTTKTMLTSGKYLEDDVTIVSTEQDEIPIAIAKAHYNFTSLGLIWTTLVEESI